MQTKSLLLSPLTREDYPFLCRLYADAEIMRYIGTGVRTAAVASAALDKMLFPPKPTGYWTLRDRATLAPVGGIMLMYRREAAPLEIGFLLAKEAWGRGFATEAVLAACAHAFEEGVSRLEAFTDARNDASARVLLKCGFRDRGISKGPYGTPDRKFELTRD